MYSYSIFCVGINFQFIFEVVEVVANLIYLKDYFGTYESLEKVMAWLI